MSETENAPPSDMEGQSVQMKGALKPSGESVKVSRTPFKDIGNNTTNTSKSPGKLKGLTPSKFEAIRTLDEDENWRDRTEVVTKLEHTNYKLFAREMVDHVITELPIRTSGTSSTLGTSPTLVKSEFGKMTFRDPAQKGMDDSVLGLDDTARELDDTTRVLDETVTFPSMDATLDPLNVPVANSTLLIASRSNPTTPNRSDTVLESSLLSSFEKMKIKGIKEEAEKEDEDEDIFHDASDDIDSFSETPSKTKETKSVSALDEDDQYSDPLDMLLSSLEKITVSERSKLDEGVTDVKGAQLSTSKTEVTPTVEEKTLQAAGKQDDCAPALADKINVGKTDSCKGDFQDPDFNPFLIGTPTEKVVKSRTDSSASPSPNVDAKSGAPSVELTDNEDLSLLAKADVKLPSSGEKEIIHHPGNDSDLKDVLSNTEKNSTVSSSEELPKAKDNILVSSDSEKGTEAPVTLVSSEYVLAVAETDSQEHSEKDTHPIKNSDLRNVLSRKEDPSSDTFVSKSDVISSDVPTEEAPSLKGEYNLEAVLNNLTCDPFASKSLVVNSDLKPDKEVNVADNFDPLAANPVIDNLPGSTIKSPNSEKLSLLVAAFKEKCNESIENEMRLTQVEGNSASETSKPDAIVSPKRKYEEAFAYELSPKRKYGEAFAGEEEDEKVLAASDATFDEGKCMKDDKLIQTVGEELTSDDKPGEVTPPKKGYNLDFLDALDDPNFNPFQTKAAVNNSPGKTDSSAKDEGELQSKTSGVVPKIESVGVKENITAVTKGEKSKGDDVPQKDDVARTAEITRENVEVNQVAVINPPSVTTFKSPASPKSQSDTQPNEGSPTKMISVKDKHDKQPLEEEEDVIVPKKGYQLDFLENLDDSKFNPFATKTSVMNSPERGPVPTKVEKDKTDVPLLKTLQEEKTEIIAHSVDAESVNIVKSPLLHNSEIDKQSKEVSPAKATSGKDLDKQSKKVSSAKERSDSDKEDGQLLEDDVIVPKKEYQLDFLENLDDPNFNPFASKASVRNSPERGLAEAKTNEDKTEAPCQEILLQEKKTEDSVQTNVDTGKSSEEKPKSVSKNTKVALKKKPNVAKPKVEEIDVKPSDGVEEEEIPVPKKGYQLDFLENLDDPNFNPFATKISVVNSPEKGLAEAKTNEDKTEAPRQEILPQEKKTEDSVQTNVDTGKSSEEKPKSVSKNAKVALKKKPNVAKPKVEEIDVKPSDGIEEEEIPVPKKGYQLDFLDKLDDPNFNPFATKISVVNSPEKGLAEAKTSENKTEAQHQEILQEEKKMKDSAQISVDTEKSEKPKSVCKDVKVALKKKPNVAKPEVESEVKPNNGMEEEEIPVPKKGYQLDFLDDLDDPNFNPFATKTTVSNSPSKHDPQTAKDKVGQMKAMCEKKLVCEQENNYGDSTPEVKNVDAMQVNNLDGVEDLALILKDNKSDGKRCQEGTVPFTKEQGCVDMQVSKAETTEAKDVESNGMKETSLPKKNYLDILDNLDDPNFNPFASKASVSNSPKKEGCTPSVDETKNEKLKKLESKVEMDDSTVKGSSSSMQAPNVKKAPVKEKPPATSETCPPPSEKSLSSVEDETFIAIAKEAMRLATEVTPSKRRLAERKRPLTSVQSQQRDAFSPQLMGQSGKSKESSGIYDFEEFVSATDFTDEKVLVEGEVFQSPILHPFFNNPGELDALGEYGTDGDKLNLVRNSLYMKFDPLVSGRQSLAPYIAQQKLLQKDETDPRRGSALICFSPSPDKTSRGENSKGTGTPMRPLFKTRADETVVVETTTNMTMNETTVCEGHNATVVTASNPAPDFSTTIISQGGGLHGDTVLQEPVSSQERMVPEEVMNRRIKEMEEEMNNKIKELEQTMKLVMQDKLLRQSRVLEDLQKVNKQLSEESEIALAGMEDENENLRSKIQQLQGMMVKVLEQVKAKSQEKERELMLLENKYELKCKSLQEENLQHQEEVKKMEVPFYDLVKKYTRLQEVAESLRRNEETLKTENEAMQSRFSKKEERFMTVLKALEEKYHKSHQEFQEEKEKHDQEKNKLLVLLKKSEVKLLSLTETVEKKSTENQRLTALIDDITKNYS